MRDRSRPTQQWRAPAPACCNNGCNIHMHMHHAWHASAGVWRENRMCSGRGAHTRWETSCPTTGANRQQTSSTAPKASHASVALLGTAGALLGRNSSDAAALV